jgi:hypothetical protein
MMLKMTTEEGVTEFAEGFEVSKGEVFWWWSQMDRSFAADLKVLIQTG